MRKLIATSEKGADGWEAGEAARCSEGLDGKRGLTKSQ